MGTNNGGGAPSAYTPELHETIVDAMRKGNYFQTACRLAGISHDTVYSWFRKARLDPEAHPEWAQLYEDIEMAKAESEAELLEVVRKTAISESPNTWQAAMTILERRHPEKFGRRDTTVVEGGENPIRSITGAIVVHESERGNPRALLERLASPRELQSERPSNDRELEAGSGPE